MQKLIKRVLSFSLFLTVNNLFAQDSTKTLNDVVVTGQYQQQSIKNSVYQIKTISSERIRLSGAANVQQILNNQIGFRFSNDNSLGITDVQLNGMAGRNVKILLDGAQVLDRSDERVSLSQIDINTIDRIEIAEGPMSVSYGTDAMAGVINIITKKNYANGFSASAKIREETTGDEYYPFSYKGAHNQNLELNYKKNNWNFSAGTTHNEFDGFGGDIYGRNKSWLPKEQWFGYGKISYRKKGFNIYYRFDGMKEDIKDRNSINIDFGKSFDQKFHTDRLMQQVQGGYRFNKNIDLSTMFSYTGLKRATVTTIKDFINGTIALGTGAGQQDVSKLNSFTFKNSMQYRISDKLSLQPGIDINHEKAGGARISGEPSIDDYALFISAEYKITPQINIRPGLRFIKNSKYDAPPAIPSVNTKFVLNKNLDLRLSYGYGFRAPALRELYFIFTDVNHNLIGNPTLKAETSNSFNGSLSWSPERLNKMNFTSVFSGFYNQYNKQIVLIQSLTNPAEYTYYNIDKTRSAGFNIDNSISYKNLHTTLGFAFIALSEPLDKTFYKNGSKDFLWTPEINSNITYDCKKLRTSFGLFYKFVGTKPAYSYESNVTKPGYYITKTDAYNLADLTATTKVNRYISIAAGVKNIFDVTDVNNNTTISSASAHSTAGALAVNYGRSYFLGLNLQWSKK